MPLARIVTHAPETVAPLADYLARRGYTVEIGAPDEVHEFAAEFEITVDTCARELAQERAEELAAQFDADVVVAPGVIPARAASIAEQPAHAQDVEKAPAVRESILARSRTVRESLAEWNGKGHAAAIATSRHLRSLVQELSGKSSVVAARWVKTLAQWARQLWIVTTVSAGKAFAAGRERIHEARVQALARAQARVEMQTRRRELAQSWTKPQQRMPAQSASSPVPLNDGDEEVVTDAASHPAKPLRRPPAPRSSLVAYTRNRDWKMAFLGATAASLLIMVVSFEFMSALPAEDDVEQTQTLPLGAATIQPTPPALMSPQKPPELPGPLPGQADDAKPVVKVEPVTTLASQSEPGQEEYLDEEVVIRHYPAGEKVKARIGADGVKRISDQD